MAHRQLQHYSGNAKRRASPLLGLALLSGVAACGGETGAVVVAVPARAGEVWELDSVSDRQRARAELLAFVSGTHVLIIDGDETFAGLQHTVGGKAPDGGQPLMLAGGIDATLAPTAGAMQLRFASGEVLALRKRAGGGEK
jgi:hypothetical protein